PRAVTHAAAVGLGARAQRPALRRPAAGLRRDRPAHRDRALPAGPDPGRTERRTHDRRRAVPPPPSAFVTAFRDPDAPLTGAGVPHAQPRDIMAPVATATAI